MNLSISKNKKISYSSLFLYGMSSSLLSLNISLILLPLLSSMFYIKTGSLFTECQTSLLPPVIFVVFINFSQLFIFLLPFSGDQESWESWELGQPVRLILILSASPSFALQHQHHHAQALPGQSRTWLQAAVSGESQFVLVPTYFHFRDIEKMFKGYGDLRNINIKVSPPLNTLEHAVREHPQGQYGFLEIDDKEDAEDAIKDLNGKSFNGGRIKIEFSYAYSGTDRDKRRGRRDDKDSRGR